MFFVKNIFKVYVSNETLYRACEVSEAYEILLKGKYSKHQLTK